jgi:hypothetical protein
MRGVVMAFASWSHNAQAGRQAKDLLKRISFRMKNQALIAVSCPTSIVFSLVHSAFLLVAVLECVVKRRQQKTQVRGRGQRQRKAGPRAHAE